MKRLKVMIVDDSALMRRIIGDMITQTHDMELIARAKDGMDALKQLESLKPDVITLDVEMPRMDGIATLEEIQKLYSIPVIMLSSLTSKNSETTMQALEKGAFDFIQKPSGSISLDINKVKEELLEKIRSTKEMFSTEECNNPEGCEKKTPLSLHNKVWSAIIIGASTGGPKTLAELVKTMPNNTETPPIFIVQHMPKGFTTSFAQRLNNLCSLEVVEAKDGQIIQRGHIYIAPGGAHMTIHRNRIVLDQREKHLGVRPSVDFLLESAAPIYKDKLLSIILTGMGRDGTQGLKCTKFHGGANIAQDKETSVIFGMPSSAMKAGVADKVLSLGEISNLLNEILKR